MVHAETTGKNTVCILFLHFFGIYLDKTKKNINFALRMSHDLHTQTIGFL